MGNKDLMISNIQTSCGWAVSEWTKEAIEPYKNGDIKVIYDAKHPGCFKKTITVFYNGKDSPKELIIKREVRNHK